MLGIETQYIQIVIFAVSVYCGYLHFTHMLQDYLTETHLCNGCHTEGDEQDLWYKHNKPKQNRASLTDMD